VACDSQSIFLSDELITQDDHATCFAAKGAGAFQLQYSAHTEHLLLSRGRSPSLNTILVRWQRSETESVKQVTSMITNHNSLCFTHCEKW